MDKTQLTEILSPSVLAKIDNYHLIARIVVEGFMSGMHRSAYHGFGTEFLQYRNYSPGDDFKNIDWKVLGRLDRIYSKVYREETNFNCTIILDSSASMAYKGSNSPCSKFKYAAMLAASIAYLASKQGDKVGAYAYSGGITAYLPSSNGQGHLNRLITGISALKPTGKALHGKNIGLIAGSIRRRGIIVLLSDFLDTDEDPADLLKTLRASKNDCIIVNTYDRDETSFPFKGPVRFIDSESGESILTDPENVRTEYLSSMEKHLAKIRKACLDSQSDYLRVSSSNDLGIVLSGYLNGRGNV